MQLFLAKGLTETISLWSDVQEGYAWVQRAAHILTNDEKQAAQVRHTYEDPPFGDGANADILWCSRNDALDVSQSDHQLLVWPLSLLQYS
jgi:hypothetical protein